MPKHVISQNPAQRQNSIRLVGLSKARIYIQKRPCHLYRGILRAYKISLDQSNRFVLLIG
jgi:hypothetical protein